MAKTDRYGNLLSGTNREVDDPMLVKRAMPMAVYTGIKGVSPMSGPVGTTFAMKAKYAGGSGMAMSKNLNSKYDDIKYTRRERLAGKDQIPYHNNLLTIDRVQQVFGYYLGNSEDGEASDQVGSEGEVIMEPWENDANRGYAYENQQLSLTLKPIEVIEHEHRTMIRKYQRAIEYMGAMALLWHDLMEDLEEHPHLKEQFTQFQFVRKLSGGSM